ncbi:transposase [Salinisphaera sp. Q1T1-3]|nr:transposase [Salinisphaera sp. Q1T1-3]
MFMSKRRRYSPEFKREAVELTRQSGVTLAQVARELGLGAGMLGRWRKELEQSGAVAFGGTSTPRDEEIARLKRENARLGVAP